jgi:membrane protease YdiL (CAAX protease family)
MNNMKKWNYAISAIVTVLGSIIIYLAAGLPLSTGTGDPGAGFWPSMLGVLLIILAIILTITTLVKRKDLEKIPVILNQVANRRVYIMMGVIVAFLFVMKFLGFYIAAFVFIPTTMLVMGERSKKKMLLVSVLTLAAIYIVFELVLKTKMPLPFFA